MRREVCIHDRGQDIYDMAEEEKFNSLNVTGSY